MASCPGGPRRPPLGRFAAGRRTFVAADGARTAAVEERHAAV